MADDRWRDRALCATETFKQAARNAGATRDPSQVFFPIDSHDDGRPFGVGVHIAGKWKQRQARYDQLARRTCDRCPVRLECLFWGMEKETEPYGVFGGMAADARMDLLDNPKAKMAKKKCACGTTLHGTEATLPKQCSIYCNGKPNE